MTLVSKPFTIPGLNGQPWVDAIVMPASWWASLPAGEEQKEQQRRVLRVISDNAQYTKAAADQAVADAIATGADTLQVVKLQSDANTVTQSATAAAAALATLEATPAAQFATAIPDTSATLSVKGK